MGFHVLSIFEVAWAALWPPLLHPVIHLNLMSLQEAFQGMYYPHGGHSLGGPICHEWDWEQ